MSGHEYRCSTVCATARRAQQRDELHADREPNRDQLDELLGGVTIVLVGSVAGVVGGEEGE